MNQKLIEEQYETLGISKEVYAFGEKIERELKERFEAIDEIGRASCRERV